MRRLVNISLLVVLLASTRVLAADVAQPLVLPPELCLASEPAEQRLLDDLADGRLDEHSVLEAALIANGTPPAVIRDCCGHIAQVVDLWRASDSVAGTPRQQVERLFDLVHQELLTGGYRVDANDLAETIQGGSYNCLTATLLWQHLAPQFDIPSAARQLPAHMQSVVVLGESKLIVELTCPQWFASTADPSMIDAVGEEGRELDDATLIASVYYNRGLAQLQQRHFPEALMATYLAHRLDPTSLTARGNVLAILNNWALSLAEHQQLPRAISLLQQGRQLAPEHESFRLNLAALHSPDSFHSRVMRPSAEK